MKKLTLNHDLLLPSNPKCHQTKEMLSELVFQNTLCLPWQPRQALPSLVIVDPTHGMARKAHFGYGFFLIIGLLLTLVAIFTPGWRSYKDKNSHEDVLIWKLISGQGAPDIGLVSRNCGSGNRQVDVYDCRAYGRFQLPFEKLTLAFMIIALLLELVSLGCFIGLFSPRARLGVPAFSATGLAFVCLFIAIVTYGVRMQYKICKCELFEP